MNPHALYHLHAKDCDGSCTMNVDYRFRLVSPQTHFQGPSVPAMNPNTLYQLHAKDCDGSCTMEVEYGLRLLSLPRHLDLEANPPTLLNQNTDSSLFFSSSSSHHRPYSNAYYHFDDDIAANTAIHGSMMSSSTKRPGPLMELDEADVNVIGYTCVRLGDGDDIDTVAKTALTKALDNAEYGCAGDQTTWGNEKGVGLLSDIEELKREMAITTSQIALLQKADTIKKSEIALLKNEDTIKKSEIALLKNEDTVQKSEIALLKNEDTVQKSEIALLKNEDTVQKSEIALLKNEDTVQKSEIALLKKEDTVKRNRIEELELRLAAVSSASQGHRMIRHRFLDVYVREHMGGATAEGRRHIREGNLVAHGADVLADAELYNSKARQDEHVFIKIYGVSVGLTTQLVECRDLESIAVINAGGYWRAQGPNEVPLDVAACYEEFVDALGLSIGKSPRTMRFQKAYDEFWACLGRHTK